MWQVLEAWWATYRRQFPWRQPGLSAYAILLAEVLLKRTTAIAAARVFPEICERYPSPAMLAAADLGALEFQLKSVGLQKQRACSLKAIATHLMDKCGGVVPDTLEELCQVPHLGPYSCRAILSFGFNVPAAVVDSNVVRIVDRVFNQHQAKMRLRDVQAVVDGLLPESHHKEFNWAMLDLGALVCRYTRPRCAECPVKQLCNHYARINR